MDCIVLKAFLLVVVVVLLVYAAIPWLIWWGVSQLTSEPWVAVGAIVLYLLIFIYSPDIVERMRDPKPTA